MKRRLIIGAALFALHATPVHACSKERWNYLYIGAETANQSAVAARRYAQQDPQTFHDAVQTFSEWNAALGECGAERETGNLQ